MTALLLTACVGMITGAFLIFHISPMDFTLGVFHRLTVGPRSIRDEINEATQRKKPNFIRREILDCLLYTSSAAAPSPSVANLVISAASFT